MFEGDIYNRLESLYLAINQDFGPLPPLYKWESGQEEVNHFDGPVIDAIYDWKYFRLDNFMCRKHPRIPGCKRVFVIAYAPDLDALRWGEACLRDHYMIKDDGYPANGFDQASTKVLAWVAFEGPIGISMPWVFDKDSFVPQTDFEILADKRIKADRKMRDAQRAFFEAKSAYEDATKAYETALEVEAADRDAKAKVNADPRVEQILENMQMQLRTALSACAVGQERTCHHDFARAGSTVRELITKCDWNKSDASFVFRDVLALEMRKYEPKSLAGERIARYLRDRMPESR